MTLQIDDNGAVKLIGDCQSDEAEALLRHLSADPKAEVDWRRCVGAHTAIVQVLIVAQVHPTGPPANSFLATFIQPLLEAELAS